MINKQERGAIMLEVLAVLALIGVMGPMLYKQVLSRNQEISNVNIAAEMRAIKEAMSAAIAADSAVLGELCGVGETDLKPCNAAEATFQATVESFLPIGMEGVLDSDYGYAIRLYSQQGGYGDDVYPIFVGVVAGADLASDWNIKRAARVANLVGTDGGITQNGDLVGTGGSWHLYDLARDLEDVLGRVPDYPIVVATTAMDTFDPDLGITDPYAVAVPEDLGFKELHAWNYFSVGSGTKNCVNIYHDKVGASDKIKRVGEESCDPLFWVDAGGGTDNTKGHVYVKKNLYIGQDGDKQAFAFETKDKNGNSLDHNRFIVYDIDGNQKLEINDKGQIIAKDATMGAGTKNDDGSYSGGTYEYGLDPANTSVLNDIRLGARGGARLSDILPNYIAKGITHLSPSAHAQEISITKPDCPDGYAAAIIVTPLKWGMPKIIRIQVPEVSATHSLKVNGTSVSGEIDIPEYSFPTENITQNRHNFAIEIDGNSNHGYDTKPAKEKNWKVKLGYKTQTTDGNFQTLSDYKSGEIQALAQTYCVYAPNDATYDANALTGDKIPDNLKK